MIENRLTQLIYRIVYCVILSFGALLSLEFFYYGFFDENFYIYFTNLSNYLCLGVMIAVTANTVKQVKANKLKGSTEYLENTKFVCSILILITFLVHNILFGKEYSAIEYFSNLSNLILHLIGPILFILDHILFDRRCSVKWYMPLISVIPALIYVVFVFIRASIIGNNSNSIKYPYFFLNPEQVGIGGLFIWLFIIAIVFIVSGYILWLTNHLVKQNGKIKFSIKSNEKDQDGINRLDK